MYNNRYALIERSSVHAVVLERDPGFHECHSNRLFKPVDHCIKCRVKNHVLPFVRCQERGEVVDLRCGQYRRHLGLLLHCSLLLRERMGKVRSLLVLRGQLSFRLLLTSLVRRQLYPKPSVFEIRLCGVLISPASGLIGIRRLFLGYGNLLIGLRFVVGEVHVL